MKTSITINPAYEEIINFLAAGITSQSLVKFQVSETVKERVSDLIFREKTDGISPEEKSELDHYLILEHLLRLAKARAYDFINEKA
ncbi:MULTISPECIES: hypothetical protein [Nostocales]|jgi:hypothetical protein|uniref:Uncharacterized protein n=2 Tax=Dolichospermum TaxID=748770 RepID=A0ACC7SCD1_DOLFA|nr:MULTISPECIES: hypothetical protein [Nostocales]MCX5982225.1 hypothetical protein [Nostocales cyanobacterium LacPavin_0920_SED1_MAG_38_18]MDK2412898.1 hypothetical protein [Aphanizomenon sp. 202]MDK2460787.1 hypothetical protein [Aphanizomenon sp. PH219]ALB39969.1 hypothetical protein AA650_05365 [Anabaena sp. WA102]MBO1063712.1 hypothetical protein [Anabaena sp. 54]